MRTEITLAAVPPMPPPLLTPPAPAAQSLPAIILFGRDERGRPHASRFAGEEIGGAQDAARLMCLHLAVAETTTLRGIVERLPAGRLFPSGKGFVPFVKGDLYDRLLAATGTLDKPRPVAAASKAS